MVLRGGPRGRVGRRRTCLKRVAPDVVERPSSLVWVVLKLEVDERGRGIRDAGEPVAAARRHREAPGPLAATAGDDRHRAALARTVGAARLAEVPARQVGAPRRTVPASRPGNRPGAVPLRRPPMVCAGGPPGTRAAVVRRRARVTGLAGRHARPQETDRGEPAGPLAAASPGPAGPPQAANTGAAGPLRAANTGAAGPLRAAS